MATTDSSTKVLHFSGDTYEFKDGIRSHDVMNHLNMRLSQLRAVTLMLYGNEPEEGFSSYSHQVQDSYLWLVDNMVEEVDALVHKLYELQDLRGKAIAGSTTKDGVRILDACVAKMGGLTSGDFQDEFAEEPKENKPC